MQNDRKVVPSPWATPGRYRWKDQKNSTKCGTSFVPTGNWKTHTNCGDEWPNYVKDSWQVTHEDKRLGKRVELSYIPISFLKIETSKGNKVDQHFIFFSNFQGSVQRRLREGSRRFRVYASCSKKESESKRGFEWERRCAVTGNVFMHQQKWQATVVKLSKCSEIQLDVGEMPLSFSCFVLGWKLQGETWPIMSLVGSLECHSRFVGSLHRKWGPFHPMYNDRLGGAPPCTKPPIWTSRDRDQHFGETASFPKTTPASEQKSHHSHDRTWDLNFI